MDRGIASIRTFKIAPNLGIVSDTRPTGKIFAARAKVMFRQQFWLLFAGVQGIVRQHCIAWLLANADGTQSPNDKDSRIPTASNENSRFIIISFCSNLRLFRPGSQEIDSGFSISASHCKIDYVYARGARQ